MRQRTPSGVVVVFGAGLAAMLVLHWMRADPRTPVSKTTSAHEVIGPMSAAGQTVTSDFKSIPGKVAPATSGVRPTMNGARAFEALPESEQTSLWRAFGEARRSVHALTAREAAMPQNAGVTHFAQNPGQDLTLRFLTNGVRIASGRAGSNWEMTLRMKGAGTPSARVRGTRVDYEHAANVTEWWENRAEGIEHGFTLSSGQGLSRTRDGVVIPVTVSGLSAKETDRGLSFINDKGQAILAYGGLKAWDAAGNDLPAVMRATGDGFQLAVNDAGAVYPVTVDPWLTLEQYIEPITGVRVELFGNVVALSGNTALIGAPREDTPTLTDAGSAYVFTLVDETWRQQARFATTDSSNYFNFGTSVALESDTALVGMIGAAYVFVRSGGSWTRQAKFTASGGQTGAFGSRVALDGDTALVGAYQSDTAAGADAGNAYVFVRSGTNWSQQVILEAADAAPGDNFGYSVAIDGDSALVGAHLADTAAGGDAGSAYVFFRDGSNWSQQAKLVAADGAQTNWFGYSVALDVDSALVGALYNDTAAAAKAGSAYVFMRSGANWSQQAKLETSDGATDDRFGCSVDIEGDTALIGANRDDGRGSTYAFIRNGGNWSHQAKLTADDGVVLDFFGWSVSLDGDRALIGAVRDDINYFQQVGSAYLFTRIDAVWSQVAKISPKGALLGYSLSSDRDRLLVGAYREDTAAGCEAGCAYVFVHTTNWGLQAKLDADDAGTGDAFGISVALDGDTALVGAYHNDAAGDNAGAAYVFACSATNWMQQAKLAAAEIAAGDCFGRSVALDSNIALVGSYYCKIDGQANAGAAYVFERDGAHWIQTAKLHASDAGSYDYFGSSAAVFGDTALIGAVYSDGTGGPETGSAYVFLREGSNWIQQAKLCASDGRIWDYFGCSVAVDGDTALIGAYQIYYTYGGAAYVFVRNDGNWTQQAKLLPDTTTWNDYRFGCAVALDGNLALVGASRQNAAYLFARGGTNWSYIQKLTGYDDGYFGGSVALENDVALIGAYGADTTWGGINGGRIYAYRMPAPEIVVEQGDGVGITSGDIMAFGGAMPNDGTNLTFTIRNTGVTNLTGLGITIDGPDAGMFSLVTGPVAPVKPASNTTFSVSFSPTSRGVKTAVLHIANDDPSENPFDINLTGRGLSVLEAWRGQHFGVFDDVGDASNTADPDVDGAANLIEFGFGRHPLECDAGQLPRCAFDGTELGITFTEPTGVDGIIYGAEYSTNLKDWLPVSDAGVGEEHIFSISVGSHPTMFLRLKVTEE